jgi:hypothetical protein
VDALTKIFTNGKGPHAQRTHSKTNKTPRPAHRPLISSGHDVYSQRTGLASGDEVQSSSLRWQHKQTQRRSSCCYAVHCTSEFVEVKLELSMAELSCSLSR